MAKPRMAFIHGFHAKTGGTYWFIYDDYNNLFAAAPDDTLEFTNVTVNGTRKYKRLTIKKKDFILSSMDLMYDRHEADRKTKEEFFGKELASV